MPASNRQLTSHLQGLLRSEFRRILAAQQAGMMVLLDAMDNEQEEEGEVEEETSRRRQRRGRHSGRNSGRNPRRRHADPLSPGSDMTEVTELPSGVELTPKTPTSHRYFDEEDEEEEEALERAMGRHHHHHHHQEAPNMRHALSELSNIRQHRPANQPRLPLLSAAAPTPFPSPALSPRAQLPFPLLKAEPKPAASKPAPAVGIPLLRLDFGQPSVFVPPPAPGPAIQQRMVPPNLIADFIRERMHRELAARQPMKVVDPDAINSQLRQRLADTLVPPPMAPPPLLSVGGFRGPVIISSRREEGRPAAFVPDETPEEEELEKKTEEEVEEESLDTETVPETPSSSRRRRSGRKHRGSPRARVDQATVTCTDAGTQADSVSDEEENQVIYQGYALTPGTAAQVDEANVPILPPDLLGNIRLDDRAGSRRFLSVVSVDHGLWDEMVGKMPGLDAQEAESLRAQAALEGRKWAKPRRASPERDAGPGPDPLTHHLLLGDRKEEEEDDEDSLAAYRKDKRSRMTANMTRTLLDMDVRLRDIKELHSKMEREFPNIHNLFEDVEAVDAEALRRYPYLKPEAERRKEKKKEKRKEERQEKKEEVAAAPEVEAAVNPRSVDGVLRLAEVVDVDEVLSGRRSPHRRISPGRESPRISADTEAGARTSEERARLRRWLAERRARQIAEYRRDRQSRVEAEARPFRASQGVEVESAEVLEQNREQRARAMAEERELEARRLAAEAIAGLGVPSVPPKPKPQPESERRTSRRKEQPAPAAEDEFEFKTYEEYDRYLDRMMELSSAATSEILNPEGDRASRARPKLAPPQEEPEELVPYKPQKRKPFTEMVRLQRPEMLKKSAARRPMNREEMFASLRENKGLVAKNPPPGSVGTSRSFGGGASDRPSGPPSRRPGMVSEMGPRQNVKTYAQRLQELQPRKPLRQANREVAGPYRSRPSQRAAARAEPYQARQLPASNLRVQDDDMTSILSDWSVSEDVKRILYGAGDDPNANLLRRTIDEVNSQALDMASEHSESTASYIDWDQIDQLVQNV